MTDDNFDPSMVFYQGQWVVCVKADYDPAQKTTIAPELVVGQVYKISWLGIYNHYLDGEYLGIRVEGIDRGTCPHWGDVDQPFRATRFRPVVSDPLTIFRRIAADPEFKPSGEEGPRRNKKLPVRDPARVTVKEEVE